MSKDFKVVMDTKIKEYCNSKDYKASKELADKVNEKTIKIVDDAILRAQQNKRTVVLARDV